MTDPILNGTNPAADRRLLDDVMAADPFDGGCAADCRTPQVPDRRTVRTMTEADLPREDRHVIAMSDVAFSLGWLRCYRRVDAIVADLPIDSEAKTTVLLALMTLPCKPATEAAAIHHREQVEMHLRVASLA